MSHEVRQTCLRIGMGLCARTPELRCEVIEADVAYSVGTSAICLGAAKSSRYGLWRSHQSSESDFLVPAFKKLHGQGEKDTVSNW
jgi:hypothetical protein